MKPHLFLKLAVTLFVLAAAVIPARATISFVDMYRTNQYVQTANGAAGTAFDSSYVDFDLIASTANEFSTVLAFYPGPDSPATLTPYGEPGRYSYRSPIFTTAGARDIAYPTGTYTFTANSSSENATTMINYANDAYSATLPFLMGTTFSDAQGLNSAAPFTFQLSPFIPDANADDKFIFFNIFDAVTGDVVFSSNFLPPNTTSVSLNAGTLNPDTAYVLDLDYSDRVFTASPGADFDATLGFDVRTEAGFFTAPVPEPGSTALLALGGFVVLLVLKRIGPRGTKTS